MEKTIWLVTSGSYSDYQVHGYCTTEEQAEKVALLFNKERRDWDVYTYEECQCLDEHAKVIKNEYIMYNWYVRFLEPFFDSSVILKEIDGPYKTLIRQYPVIVSSSHRHGDATLITYTVQTNRNDQELAKKIACDEIAKYMAEKYGL